TELTSHAILHWQEERGSGGTTSHPESRCRTPSSRASMAASATSASTSTCSVACLWHGGSLKLCGSITMPAGRTPVSAVWPRTSLQPVPTGPQPERMLVMSEGDKGAGSVRLDQSKGTSSSAASPTILGFHSPGQSSLATFVVPVAQKRDRGPGRYRNLENVG